MFPIPVGWSVLYANPTIDTDHWERDEDLLQLHHAALDRLVDLGWYRKEFAIFVFQGDFHGRQLAEFRTNDQATALTELGALLRKWGARSSP